MKLKPANDRGFLRGEFTDLYGAKCSIQASSLATDTAIWLGINEPEVKIMGPKGWEDVPIPEQAMRSGRMHLNRELVLQLLPMLQHFAMTGYLPPNSKPTHVYCKRCQGSGWVMDGPDNSKKCKKCKRGLIKVSKKAKRSKKEVPASTVPEDMVTGGEWKEVGEGR